jgi:hypothetical protein
MEEVRLGATKLCQHFGERPPPDPYKGQYKLGVEFWLKNLEKIKVFKNPVDGVWIAQGPDNVVAFDRYYGALPMVDLLAKISRRHNVRMGP